MEAQKKRAEAILEEEQQKAEEKQQEKDLRAIEIASYPIPLHDIRNETNLMRYPFFSTDHTLRSEPIIFEKGERRLEVRPAVGLGMATERDADILRYVIKKLVYANDRSGGGKAPGVLVTRRELLTKVFGGSDGSINYKDLEQKLKRLTQTTYNTNIFSKDPKEFYSGSLCSSRYWKGDDGIERLVIYPCQPLWESVQKMNVRAIDIGFFREKGNLRKKLLEIIKVHFYNQEKPWPITLKTLALQCAYTKEVWRFKEALKRAKLPYPMTFHNDSTRQQVVTFYPR